MHAHRTIPQRVKDNETLIAELLARVDALERKVAKQTRTTAAPEQAS